MTEPLFTINGGRNQTLYVYSDSVGIETFEPKLFGKPVSQGVLGISYSNITELSFLGAGLLPGFINFKFLSDGKSHSASFAFSSYKPMVDEVSKAYNYIQGIVNSFTEERKLADEKKQAEIEEEKRKQGILFEAESSEQNNKLTLFSDHLTLSQSDGIPFDVAYRDVSILSFWEGSLSASGFLKIYFNRDDLEKTTYLEYNFLKVSQGETAKKAYNLLDEKTAEFRKQNAQNAIDTNDKKFVFFTLVNKITRDSLDVLYDECVLYKKQDVSGLLSMIAAATEDSQVHTYKYTDLTGVDIIHSGGFLLSSMKLKFKYAGANTNPDCHDDEFEFNNSVLVTCTPQEVVTFINKRISESKSSGNLGGGSVISSADELLKFKNLLDMGVITPEEFEKKKKQLLKL